jgi:hypothetical protein
MVVAFSLASARLARQAAMVSTDAGHHDPGRMRSAVSTSYPDLGAPDLVADSTAGALTVFPVG